MIVASAGSLDDCMAYGYARVENRPLLFEGNGFALTDIEPALKD